MREGNLTAALAYLARGWSVTVLCSPDHAGFGSWHTAKCFNSTGKVPWHKWKALQEKPASDAQIRQWFAEHPNSNVGICLGPVSGLIRIDIDGDEAERQLLELSKGDLPATLEFSSGNGRGLFK